MNYSAARFKNRLSSRMFFKINQKSRAKGAPQQL